MTHDLEFKKEAVHGLRCINEHDFYYTIDGILVKTIRRLVSLLNISSSTLYSWDKLTGIIPLKPELYIPIGLEYEAEPESSQADLEVLGFEGEGDVIPDFSIENSEMRDDFFSDSMEVKRKPYDNGIFNGRFYAWLGAGLNVPYASRNAKETNLLKIGLELIKRSGLVECDKIKKAMRVN